MRKTPLILTYLGALNGLWVLAIVIDYCVAARRRRQRLTWVQERSLSIHRYTDVFRQHYSLRVLEVTPTRRQRVSMS